MRSADGAAELMREVAAMKKPRACGPGLLMIRDVGRFAL